MNCVAFELNSLPEMKCTTETVCYCNAETAKQNFMQLCSLIKWTYCVHVYIRREFWFDFCFGENMDLFPIDNILCNLWATCKAREHELKWQKSYFIYFQMLHKCDNYKSIVFFRL